MEQVTTIGLDIAKSVLQVHGIAADGTVVVRRELRCSRVLPFLEKQACGLVGIEVLVHALTEWPAAQSRPAPPTTLLSV
jgi:transposase